MLWLSVEVDGEALTTFASAVAGRGGERGRADRYGLVLALSRGIHQTVVVDPASA